MEKLAVRRVTDVIVAVNQVVGRAVGSEPALSSDLRTLDNPRPLPFGAEVENEVGLGQKRTKQKVGIPSPLTSEGRGLG
jgi:hypothetical protein